MLAKRVSALLEMQYSSLIHLYAYAVACSRVESHVSNTCGSITQPMSSDCPRSASVLICRFTVLADRNSDTNFNIRERARDFSKDSLYTTYPPPTLSWRHLGPPNIVTMSTDNPARSSENMTGAGSASDNQGLLNPVTSQRRYWRDPLTGIQREIWRPGTILHMAYFPLSTNV
jgi:hypothetical protein